MKKNDQIISPLMETKHKGAYNELTAVLWLMKQGFDVFRNVSPHGIIDLIAVKDNDVLFIDVKASDYLSDGTHVRIPLHAKQVESGVKCLMVLPDGQCILDVNPRIQTNETSLVCQECDKPFVNNRPKKFCSKLCSNRHYLREEKKKLGNNG